MSDCWTCKHSMGADKNTADRLLLLPTYRRGEGAPKDGMALLCQLHYTVHPAPYKGCGYEREAGSE